MYYHKLLRINLFIHKTRLISSCSLHFCNSYYTPSVFQKSASASDQFCYSSSILFNNNNKRDFSLQNSIQEFVKTQAGIFKFISESAPVHYIQEFLIYFHEKSTLPWWTSIILTTILFRSCLTLPLALYQQLIFAKIENISLEMKGIGDQLKKEVGMAIKLYKWDEKTAKYHFNRSMKKQWNILVVKENCHPFKAALLMLFQIPLWICYSVSLRNLVYMLPKRDFEAELHFVELSVGGFGWIPNLTLADSTLILPATLGILTLAIVEIQASMRKKEPSRFQKIITNSLRGFSIIIIPVSACVPSCLLLYWTTSTAFGLIQNILIMSPKLKRFCRIPKAPSEIEKPYSFLAESLKNRVLNLKNNDLLNHFKNK